MWRLRLCDCGYMIICIRETQEMDLAFDRRTQPCRCIPRLVIGGDQFHGKLFEAQADLSQSYCCSVSPMEGCFFIISATTWAFGSFSPRCMAAHRQLRLNNMSVCATATDSSMSRCLIVRLAPDFADSSGPTSTQISLRPADDCSEVKAAKS